MPQFSRDQSGRVYMDGKPFPLIVRCWNCGDEVIWEDSRRFDVFPKMFVAVVCDKNECQEFANEMEK